VISKFFEPIRAFALGEVEIDEKFLWDMSSGSVRWWGTRRNDIVLGLIKRKGKVKCSVKELVAIICK